MDQNTFVAKGKSGVLKNWASTPQELNIEFRTLKEKWKQFSVWDVSKHSDSPDILIPGDTRPSPTESWTMKLKKGDLEYDVVIRRVQ